MRIHSIYLALIITLLCPYASAQWVQTRGTDGRITYCFGVTGTNLFAGTDAGVIRSTDNGTSWNAVTTLSNSLVYCFLERGTDLFAGTWHGGVLRSTDSGTSWIGVNTGLTWTKNTVNALAVSGTNLFAGTYHYGIFRSNNDGTSWTAVNEGLPKSGLDTTEYLPMYSFVASGQKLFVGSPGGLFLSTNDGMSWTGVNNGLTNTLVFPQAISDTNLFAGTQGDGVFLSTNDGTSWTPVNNGLTSTFITALAVSGADIFAGTAGSGVFLSTNNGASWTAVNNGLASTSIYALAVSGTHLFAGTNYPGGIWRRPLVETTEVGSEDLLQESFALAQNYPNPFNPKTGIRYSVPPSAGRDLVSTSGRDGQVPGIGDVKLVVYDLLGREVAVLVDEEKSPGSYEVTFDGGGLSSGVYFYRLQAGDLVQTKTLVILK
jgi:hypothetical protein